MPKVFVVSRIAPQRLRVSFGDFRTEMVGDDPKQIPLALSLLDLNKTDAKLRADLEAAKETFLSLERQSEAKFGKDKTFRIWRVDAKTLQVDFKGAYAVFKDSVSGDAALKKLLKDLFANDFLLPELKRDLTAFRKDEPQEPLSDVSFFRDGGVLKVLAEGRVYDVSKESDDAIVKLGKTLKLAVPERLLATHRAFRSIEAGIREALGRAPI